MLAVTGGKERTIEYLIARKYTSPEHLAIVGASNGGLLMGAAVTQRPDLFHAVGFTAGIYDMLRVELDPNGEFNVTEFGTVKDLNQFQALYAYSPYHHAKDGTPYPGILFFTGENDHRVDPMQSRKMMARLQAANTYAPGTGGFFAS
jgi:prolyl oligopeptidase